MRGVSVVVECGYREAGVITTYRCSCIPSVDWFTSKRARLARESATYLTAFGFVGSRLEGAGKRQQLQGILTQGLYIATAAAVLLVTAEGPMRKGYFYVLGMRLY